MLNLPPSCRVWLALAPCDMRKGFQSLLAEARSRWQAHDPLGGDLYIFLGRQRTTVKVLWWSAGGLSLYSNPAAYIADVLMRIQDHPAARVDELLPMKWTPRRPCAARARTAADTKNPLIS